MKTLHASLEPRNNKIVHTVLAKTKMAFNISRHANRELSHLNRFGLMPRIIDEKWNSSVQQGIAIMEIFLSQLSQGRASRLLSKVCSPFHRYDISLKTFSPNQKVWLYRKTH